MCQFETVVLLLVRRRPKAIVISFSRYSVWIVWNVASVSKIKTTSAVLMPSLLNPIADCIVSHDTCWRKIIYRLTFAFNPLCSKSSCVQTQTAFGYILHIRVLWPSMWQTKRFWWHDTGCINDYNDEGNEKDKMKNRNWRKKRKSPQI